MKLRLLLSLLFISVISFGQIPTNGLKSYYQLDNASTADLLGLDDLVQTGTSTQTTINRFGNSNTAIKLNGDSFSRGDISYGQFGRDDFSVSFWIKTSTNSTDSKTIIDNYGKPFSWKTDTKGSLVSLENGKITLKIWFILGGLNQYFYNTTSNFIADGNWHHVTVVSDNVVPKIFVDTELVASTTIQQGVYNFSSDGDYVGNIHIAQNNDNSLLKINQYQDDLDDVAFYDRALTTTEIENIGNDNGFCFPPTDDEITFTNVKETTAAINWTGTGNYDIAYGLSSDNFSNYTQILGLSTNNYSLSNLTSLSSYSIYIRKQCSSTLSSSWNIVNFTTNGTVYVNSNATGTNDGTSFVNGYTDLSIALANHPGNEFWIANGTYIPTNSGASARNTSFNITESTKLYGGFNGTESSLNDRDLSVNATYLSGDINGDDNAVFNATDANRLENSFRILNINGTNVIIDGFIITSANANGSSVNEQEGSGININGPYTVNISNCQFTKHTLNRAGVIKSIDNTGNVTINVNNTIFRENESIFATCFYGRANNGSIDLTFEGSLFVNNKATTTNGASLIWLRQDLNGSQNLKIINSTFTKNILNSGTPTITYLSNAPSVEIYNSIFWNNTNLFGTAVDALQTGTSGTISNNISNNGFSGHSNISNITTTNPDFTDSTNNDFTLSSTSPAINIGDNSKVPGTLTKDLLGNSRIFNSTIDLGPYEFGSSIPMDRTLIITANNGTVTTNPNPTNGIYNDGTTVTLTATAASGFQFDSWSGGASGNTNPLTITMDSDKNITAIFSQITRTLAITSTNGTVTTNPNPTNGIYTDGAVVNLTATANTGYKFVEWTGDAAGNTNPLNITMDADKNITATFGKVTNIPDTNFEQKLIDLNLDDVLDGQVLTSTIENITSLDVRNSSIADLTGIEDFAGILHLYCSGNQLTSLDLSYSSNFVSLYLDNNELTSLTLCNNTNLDYLSVNNNNLSSLTVPTSSTVLRRLNVSNNDLTSLDVSNFTALEELIMSTTLIQTVDLSKNSALVYFTAFSSKLTNLDLTTNMNIASIYLGGQDVTSLDLRNGNLSTIGYVETDTAPNLTCVFVDDDSNSVINNWLIHANNTIVETDAQCSSVLSTKDINQFNFDMFPNPTKGFLTISTIENIKKVSIYNLIGKKVETFKSKEIDLTSFAKGVYILKIETESGKINMKKVMKN